MARACAIHPGLFTGTSMSGELGMCSILCPRYGWSLRHRCHSVTWLRGNTWNSPPTTFVPHHCCTPCKGVASWPGLTEIDAVCPAHPVCFYATLSRKLQRAAWLSHMAAVQHASSRHLYLMVPCQLPVKTLQPNHLKSPIASTVVRVNSPITRLQHYCGYRIYRYHQRLRPPRRTGPLPGC